MSVEDRVATWQKSVRDQVRATIKVQGRLDAALERREKALAATEEAITTAEADLVASYRDLVEVTKSVEVAAELLELPVSRLRAELKKHKDSTEGETADTK